MQQDTGYIRRRCILWTCRQSVFWVIVMTWWCITDFGSHGGGLCARSQILEVIILKISLAVYIMCTRCVCMHMCVCFTASAAAKPCHHAQRGWLLIVIRPHSVWDASLESTGPYNTLVGPRENVNESTGCNLLTWARVSKVYNKNIKPLCTKIQTATLTLYCRCLRTTCIKKQVFHELSIRIIHCVKVISSQLK